MEYKDIPILQARELLKNALDKLWTAKSRSIIVNKNATTTLFPSEVVVNAYRESISENINCGDLNEESGISIVDITATIRNRGFTNTQMLRGNTGLREAIANHLNLNNINYGYVRHGVAASQDVATLFTKHEGLLYDITNRPLICMCTGPGKHRSKVSNAEGKACTKCGDPYKCY